MLWSMVNSFGKSNNNRIGATPQARMPIALSSVVVSLWPAMLSRAAA